MQPWNPWIFDIYICLRISCTRFSSLLLIHNIFSSIHQHNSLSRLLVLFASGLPTLVTLSDSHFASLFWLLASLLLLSFTFSLFSRLDLLHSFNFNLTHTLSKVIMLSKTSSVLFLTLAGTQLASAQAVPACLQSIIGTVG